MAIELATAYVSIVPETKGFDKKLKAALQGSAPNLVVTPKVNTSGAGAAANTFMSNFAGRAERLADKAGDRIGNMVVNGMKRTALAGAATVAAGVGTALFKGFDRYKSLDATAKRLGSMGKSANEVRSIMADINSVVEGTPIALDAASQSAVQFLQGGVKEGKQLKDVLTAIADASGASGTEFGDLALIFGQVMNKGKLQAEEMLQLNERNIGIQSALRKEFGWTGDELTNLARDGKITFDQLVQAIDGSFGGMAKRAGDTVDGAISNMKAAVGRVGANFLSTIFGDPLSTTEGPGGMAEALNKVTEKLNGLNAWIGAHSEDILGFLANMGTASVTMAQSVVLSFTYVTRSMGWLVNVVGDVMGGMTKAVSGVNRLLGRDEIADELDRTAEGMFAWGDALLDAANKGDEAYKSLDGMFWSITKWKADAQDAAKFTRELGKAVSEVAGKDVILKTPTAEDLAAIDQAKWKIISIPDSKDVIIRPQTSEAAAELNSFREKEGAKPVVFMADPNLEPAESDMEAFRRAQGQMPVTPPVRPDLTSANSAMQSFVDQWSKTIIAPTVAPNTPGFTGGAGGPTNPLTAPLGTDDSGGVMMPNAAATKSYYESQGFQVGGYAPKDSPEDEHQTGEATDVMVPSIYAGNALLPNALRRPGVQYIIWNNKMWYPDGSTKPYSGPSPHTDHLHVRQKANGGSITGPGGPKSDKIPAWLSNGEHVLTAEDVQAMGGQSGVYAFRSMLHGYSTGGAISTAFLNPDLPYFGRDKTDGSAGREREKDHKPANPEFGSDTQPGIRESLDGHRVRGPWGNVLTGAPWWFFPGDDKYQPGSPGARNRRDVLGFADGGAVGGAKKALELLRKNTSNLESVVHGKGNGVPVLPGPAPEEIQPPDAPVEAGRTEGYIPAAAGSTAKVGESPLAGIIGMGAEVINGLIDQAASAASTAAGAALAAGTMGAGAAGSPAAAAATDAAIGMATGAAKRGVQWGADMIGIVADSAVEQIFPFGAPRWLGSADPTAFMPQMDILSALTTTNEKGIAAAAQQSAVDPLTTQHGQAQGAAPGPVTPQALEGVGALAQAAEEATNWAAPPQPAMVHVENITAADSASVGASIAKQQRLEMMRFAGRP